MKQNEANIKKEVSETQAGVKELKDIQEANTGLQSTKGGPVADDAMKAIYGDDWGKVLGHKLTASPVLELANDTTGSNPGMVVQTLNEAAKVDPNIAKEMNGLSKDELKKIGIDNPSKHPSATDYIQQQADKKKLETIAPNDVDGFLDMMFGTEVSTKDVQNNLDKINAYAKLTGQGNFNNLDLDKNKDGKIDDPATLKKTLQDKLGNTGMSLKDVVAGQQPGKASGTTSESTLYDKMREINSSVWGKLVNRFTGTSSLDGVQPDDLKDAAGNYVSEGTLKDIYYGLPERGISLDKESKNTVAGALERVTRNRIDNELLNQVRQGGMSDLSNIDVSHIDKIMNQMKVAQGIAERVRDGMRDSFPQGKIYTDWKRAADDTMNRLSDAIVQSGNVGDARKAVNAGYGNAALREFVAADDRKKANVAPQQSYYNPRESSAKQTYKTNRE